MKQRKREIIDRYGPWTAHNIQLPGETYTIGKRVVGDEFKLRRIIQVISDVVGESVHGLRILDLACLEGLYAVELALRGARVVAIEGRKANIEKAKFAKEILSLEHLELFHDDVRNFTREKYGDFDVILCLGILYHLDVPDVFLFLENIGRACKRLAIIDTEVTMSPERCYEHKGKKYWGKTRIEHCAASTAQQRAKSLWASLDNLTSFCFSRPSLYNFLSHVGFTSVYQCYTPRVDEPWGRNTILAAKGRHQKLRSSELVNLLPQKDCPEVPRLYLAAVRILQLVPERLRNAIARMLFR